MALTTIAMPLPDEGLKAAEAHLTEYWSVKVAEAGMSKSAWASGLTVSSPVVIIGPQRRSRSHPRIAREKTLAYVNTARAAVDYPPMKRLPPGIRGDANRCVLARALPGCGSVSGQTVTFRSPEIAKRVARAWATPYGGGVHVAVPYVLTEFVLHFDNGAYPDLTSRPL